MSRRGTGANPPVLKRYGQHFLGDQAVLAAIAEAVAPQPGDVVIEIGPGRGALTDILVARPNRLIAIEIDHVLSGKLAERYAAEPHVTILERDVLQVDLAEVAGGPFVVVGNVPYYITTPILFHVLRPPLPRHAVFLVQKEVAARIVAGPGSKAYGALSVNVQAVARAEILRIVKPGAFSPPPKVDSAIVRVVPREDPIVTDKEAETFRTFVQALFGMRRKQLGNALRSAADLSGEQVLEVLKNLDMDSALRAETLTPLQLVELMRAARAAGRAA